MLFFDMDGVLATYTPEDYEGDPMPFEVLGAHYFRHRPMEEGGCELLRHTASLMGGRAPVVALSTLSEGALQNPKLRDEHRIDKSLWLSDLCAKSGIHQMPLIFAHSGVTTKPKVAERFLGRPIAKCDVLVDDFNDNLESWRRAGGTAVKYLNGQNDPSSWAGPSVSIGQIQDAAPAIAATASGKPEPTCPPSKSNSKTKQEGAGEYLWNLM